MHVFISPLYQLLQMSLVLLLCPTKKNIYKQFRQNAAARPSSHLRKIVTITKLCCSQDSSSCFKALLVKFGGPKRLGVCYLGRSILGRGFYFP